ncbi:casein kinase 1 [Trichoderma chlorosporum]
MSKQIQKHVINERWRLDGIIGQGGFGSVYIATDLKTNRIVAVKLQNLPPTSSPSQMDNLESESFYYTLLRKKPGIATLHDNGRHEPYEYMVCELLGASLQSLFHHCGKKFSLKTTLMLADQLIQRLETFHARSILHRDIKPDNFAMGFGREDGKTVYILDFGLVGDYVNDEEFVSAPSDGFCGTYYWAPTAAHLDRSQSPKDDLESLAYMLIYFARGSLPWQGSVNDNEASNLMGERITRLKLTLPIHLICKDLPSAFARHLMYVRSLTYNDRPDYAGLRAMYRRLMKRLGHEYDGVFDWDLTDNGSSSIQDERNKERLNLAQDALPAKPVIAKNKGGKPMQREKRAKIVIKNINREKNDKKEDKQQESTTARPKRRIILVNKAKIEKQAPRRLRSRPAQAEKKPKKEKVVAKKTPENKVIVKKAPQRKQPARTKAC